MTMGRYYGNLKTLIWTLWLWLYVAANPCNLAAPPSSLGPTNVPEKYRFIFVVDTSGSMMGRGDGKAIIFPKVKEEILRFLGRIPEGSEIIIVPFHQGPQGEERFILPADKARAEAYIRTLQATGQNTWIYRTLVRVLDRLPQNPNLATVIYIFTDGIDNDRTGPYRMRDVVERLKLKQGPYDWIYYVALGVSVPPEVKQGFAALPRTRVQEAQVGSVPQLGSYTVKPSTLQLGNLKLTPSAETTVLLEAQGTPGPLKVRVDDASLQEKGAFLQVTPPVLTAGKHNLQFQLMGGQALPDGVYDAWLCLQAPEGTLVRPEALRIRFAHHPPAIYKLVPEQVPEQMNLRPGETGEALYRLEGNRWATEPATLEVITPKGLEARINGRPSPTQVAPGEKVVVAITNQALGAGQRGVPTLQLQAPTGAQVAGVPSFPLVVQPTTPLDWLMRLWPLLLLPLIAVWWWWRSRQPWGECTFIGAPPECQEKTLHLKGKRVDLGTISGEEELKGLVLERSGDGAKITQLPTDLKVRVDNFSLEEGDTVSPGETLGIESRYDPNKRWSLQLKHVR